MLPLIRSLSTLGTALGFTIILLILGGLPALAQSNPRSVLPEGAMFTTPVGGLERTNASTRIVPVTGQPFSRALSVTIRAGSAETNATQLTMPISTTVQKGDALLASFYVRGSSAQKPHPSPLLGKKREPGLQKPHAKTLLGNESVPGRVELLFERVVDPWTNSVTHAVVTSKNPQAWIRVLVPFTAAESYQSGEAMVSLRFAFGPQTVMVGGLAVLDYGTAKNLADLEDMVAEKSPLGQAHVTVNLANTRQTLGGFGGNFCQPRYGFSDAIDAVGRYNLAHLKVAQARVGIPLNQWTPERGVYKDSGPSHAALMLMRDLARRKIPIIGSVWEGPSWLLPGRAEESGRTLAPERYSDCIEAITRFLVTARDQYGADVAYYSFNEADYGINFKFTPEQIDAFIRQAGPRFRAAGLKTKFLVGDTGGGSGFPAYVRPLLADKEVAPYLGPLAFHCWDALSASEDRYAEIARVGKETGKPIWSTECGWDAGLWRRTDPWPSWDNGLNLALAYARTLRLTGASVMDYWTYEDNYPLVTQDGKRPYPAHAIIKQMQDALPVGAKLVVPISDSRDLSVLGSVGPKKSGFSVLLVNPAGDGTVTITGLPPRASAAVLTNDGRVQAKAVVRTNARGSLTLHVRRRSVVSVRG